MKNYIGNSLQIKGVEQYVLQNGGKGNGMRFLYVRNGLGLQAWISLDRAGDISRLNFKGDEFAFFSPCGYVAPQYYDNNGVGFLKSFTAGFCTTCGLTAVGQPCVDDGEELPLHGTISHIPADVVGIEENDNELRIKLKIVDGIIFGRKLVLNREYVFSYTENSIILNDIVTNNSENETPYMILYHCNMGYPLLTENSIIKIPNNGIATRDENAEKHLAASLIAEKPQANFIEQCFYYDVIETDSKAKAGIFNGDINKGLVMEFNKNELPCFTEWKMMGKTDYVLGLEPGNCTPDGRDVLRKNGTLKFLKPEESGKTTLKFNFVSNENEFNNNF